MKILDIWKSKKKPSVSFELFPARSPKGAANLENVINKLADLEPDFVSVTFGAGGSTKKGSSDLIDILVNQKGLNVLAYVACYGLAPADLGDVLARYTGMGVENFLAVRGDPPREQEGFELHPDSFPHASDFIPFVRSRVDVCLGAAGYPEGHIEADSKDQDLAYLKLKVEQGAQFIIANYFYDNSYFFDFRERCRSGGIDVPILPGVMPVYTVKMMESLANLCGATITGDLRRGLSDLAEDDKAGVLQFGINFAIKQCRELLKNKVPGIHIYTMDRSKSSTEIVQSLRGEGLL